ncbi:nitroreductase [Gammaproteobacteria bacterium]|jgi:nitroreductase|nr:nitroreductase [Gammaproteobacteria bacterium]
MNVSDAMISRKSTRAFLDKSVETSLLKKLIQQASRSPSGGNVQPWKIYVINGDGMTAFKKFSNDWSDHAEPQYSIYPPNLQEPYRTSRFEMGEQMYELLKISRDMKDKRMEQVMKNFDFFGAPAALFCYIEKEMGPPQWSDLGMFLQSFMLLATEQGLATCAQESWSIKHDCVSNFLKIQTDDILFCGICIGFEDTSHPLSKLVTKRRPITEWVNIIE